MSCLCCLRVSVVFMASQIANDLNSHDNAIKTDQFPFSLGAEKRAQAYVKIMFKHNMCCSTMYISLE